MIARDATIPLRCSGVFRGSELRGRFGRVQVWHPPEDSTGTRSRERQKKRGSIPTAMLQPAPFLGFPRIKLFQFRADRILACRRVPAHLKDIRLAAYLAVFNILLSHAGGGVHPGFIPLAASCALKARCHVCLFDRTSKKWPGSFCQPLYWSESATEPLLKSKSPYVALCLGRGSHVAAGFHSYIRGFTARCGGKIAPVREEDAHHDWQHGHRDVPSDLLPNGERHSGTAGARYQIRERELQYFQPRPQHAGAFSQADYDCNRYGVRQSIPGGRHSESQRRRTDHRRHRR